MDNDIIAQIHKSAKGALDSILGDADERNYDPPANGNAVAELEWIIEQTKEQCAT